MKIFGKRKKKALNAEGTSAPSDAVQESEVVDTEKEDVRVRSYFDSNFRPSSSFADKEKGSGTDARAEIERLLAMDPSELNSKQRRILKRHKKREGETEKQVDVTEEESREDKKEEPKKKEEPEPDASVADEQGAPTAAISTTKESSEGEKLNATTSNSLETSQQQESDKPLAEQLKGLNSKERRKLLRKLRRDGDDDAGEANLAEVEDEAKRIAEENRQQQEEQSKKRKRDDAQAAKAQVATKKKSRRRKGNVDLSSLPPEERARREKQREMQAEARKRREAGEVDETRHPLNSERRRANRRKPGRAGKIAALKREARQQKEEGQASYRAGGYTLRKAKSHGPAEG